MKSGTERSRMRRFASLLPAFVLCVSAFGQGTSSQQINLLPIADQRYGVAPFQVIALASSYLPVTITATGPVTLDGRWLTVTGVGTVTVSAHQAGNIIYAPADAEEQFTILPGQPVVQAQPATIVYGTPFNPSIFSASATAVPAADPAADVPTITSQFDTSQITGGASVSAPYNSPLLRYESSPMIESVTASGREGTIPDPTMAVDHYYKVAFTCDCQRFEFAIQSRTANYRLWVDGSWTNADAEPLADDSPRTLFYQVAFPDKRPRQIKVMLDEDTPFFGVNAAASDTISAPQVPLGKRAIIFGDSLTTPIISEPTLPPIQPGRAGSGYPQVLGEYFNWDWWESGVSGSGFTVGGVDNLTFVQRALTDICGRNPDLVVLFGGLNDASSTEQSTQQGATDFLSEVNACLPGTPIYLLGPQQPSTSVETAMAAAAALFPTTVDFAGTAPQYWIYGDRSDPTTGNAYLYLGDLSDNGGHPTPLGHDFLAEEVAASILGLSPSLAPQAFNLFAPAPAIGSFGYSQAANTVLGAGDHQISITFTPADAVNYAVVTQPVLITVNRASSSLALTASATNILTGGNLTLTASVSPQIAGVPTGTVTFTADGQPLGNAPLDASGSAAFTTAGLALGTHSISASYAGDGNFLSAPPPLPVKIIVKAYPTKQIAGSLAQISVGADGSVWGVNSAQQIFRYDSSAGGWTQIPGALVQVAVGSSTAVWGINAQQQIYRFDPATQNWDRIPGSLSQIAVGADGDVWGINSGQSVYHYVSAAQGWEYIPTTLTQIAVGFDGAVWGLGSGGNNYGRDVYRFNVGTRSFEQVPGELSQIAVGADGDVWGVNGANGIYHFNTLVQNWEQIQGSLSQISVGSATNVWGLDSSGNVYTFSTQAQNWTQIPGTLKQISAGANGSVLGINSADNIYQFVQPLQPTNAWHAVPGALLTQVAVSVDGNVWALDGTTAIYHYNPLIQNWEKVPGSLSQIAVGFGGDVWGINSGASIYRYNASIQNWENVPGELSQIAVGANGDVWGINSVGNIYRFDSAAQVWEQIPGNLKQLSMGADGAVWGINSAQQIFAYNPNAGGWTQIPGGLVQIAVGSSSSIWGLNAGGNIYQFNLQTQNWNSIPGNLSQIAVGFDGTVWGINSASQIFRYDTQLQGWDYVPGSLNQITVGADAAVWGVNSAQTAYRFW